MFFIGQAKDIHKLKKCSSNQKIKLGGFEFLSNYKIIAHSDGDLVLHAISNAILGSVQKFDIGEYFSDKDQKNKNINSINILNFALEELKKQKMQLVNIDMTIICENIMLSEYKASIIKSLQQLTKCKKINVKATRYESESDFIECDVVLLVK